MSKVGRNDPCSCGSGLKFKKCCEQKVKKKLFKAEVISSTAGLAGLFKNNVTTKMTPRSAPQETFSENVEENK